MSWNYETRFHWKFWRPIKAIGGWVFFGPYVMLATRDEDGELSATPQTNLQWQIKHDMFSSSDHDPRLKVPRQA